MTEGGEAISVLVPVRNRKVWMLKHVRPAMLSALVLVHACGSGPEGPAPRGELIGIWDLIAVNGDTLPAMSPDEPDVLLQSVTLTLEGGGDYSLSSSFREDEGVAQTTTLEGTWGATHDALRFDNQQGPAVVLFGYTREGNTMRLVDEELHEWLLRRR